MGRHKCEVIACLSIQTQCKLIVILCTEFMANKFDLIDHSIVANVTWPRFDQSTEHIRSGSHDKCRYATTSTKVNKK